MNDVLRSDYHIHPLGHRYWKFAPGTLRDSELTENDKARVRAVVDWCAAQRRLSSIAITDHDMTAPSLYAREHTRHNGIAIEIHIGAECEVRAPDFPPGKDWVHVLCYGLQALPEYTHATPLPDFAAAAHKQGAYLVMAHPVMYPQIFEKYHFLFDGYERQSGSTPSFQLRQMPPNCSCRAFSNSDFHYKGVLPPAQSPSLWSNPFVLHT